MDYFSALIFLCMVCDNTMHVWATMSADSFDCNWAPKVCAATPICKMTKPRGNAAYLNVYCSVADPMDQVMVMWQIYQKVKKNYEPTGSKTTLNICMKTDSSDGNPIVNSIIRVLLSNVKNLDCPIHGNVSLHRFPLMLNMAQGLLPNGNYLVYVLFYKDDLTLLNANVSFTVSDTMRM